MGFASTVYLTVAGLPPGASGTFDPISISGSGSSTLNISTLACSTPAGTYGLTITFKPTFPWKQLIGDTGSERQPQPHDHRDPGGHGTGRRFHARGYAVITNGYRRVRHWLHGIRPDS